MRTVHSHPARIAILESWYEHEFPEIEAAYEELGKLLQRLKLDEEWKSLTHEQKLEAIVEVTTQVHRMLGQVVLPF